MEKRGDCAVTEWQPIETAPKDDGTKILAWFDEAEQIIILWWFNEMWRFQGSHVPPLPAPTHWMPLPEPPK
jgi:hypothetical protein